MSSPSSTPSSSPPSGTPPSGGPRPRALLVDDARFDNHASGAYHPERPERLTAARAAASKAKVAWERVPAREATSDELAGAHDPAFVEALERLRGERGYLDPDTFVAQLSVQAARLAAGGLVDMIDAMVAGDTKPGVALLRPPGHHARPAQAMGFCLLNNVAVAAAHAVKKHKMQRVLVVDWDVHHGNGTQEIFWRDPSVLYMSTHQWPFYPGTGGVKERGEGPGEGYTVNVPLTAHGGDAVYGSAFEQVLLPIAEAYAPELVIVSAGFDAAARDPLAQMELTNEAFGWMARGLAKVAAKTAGGRIALVLEGGYDLVALEGGLGRAIDGLLHPDASGPDIGRDQDHVDVARARRAAERVWGSRLT